MVVGIGTDIVEIARIKKLIDNYGLHFLQKVFTAREIEYCGGKAHPEVHFSGRWAVKESFYKALPGELQPEATWKCIEILASTTSGGPKIYFTDKKFEEKCFRGGITNIHLSISHERLQCIAVVLLE